MALRNRPYLPLYVDDFLADEKLSLCSAESTGVYIRLMCLMHKSDEYGVILLKQKFKQNAKQILNFASLLAKQMPYQVDVIERSLQELLDENVIILDGDKLIQKRMVKDENLSNIRSLAGSRGGQKTQTKTDNFASTFAQAKSQANTVIGIVNENETVNGIKDTNSDVNNFDAFWSAYPRKVGKEAARKSFSKIPKSEIPNLIPAIENQKQSEQWKKENGRYIPNPATWLNQGRWQDEVFIPENKGWKTSNPFLELLQEEVQKHG